VSLFYHMAAFKATSYSGTWEQFVEHYLAGQVMFGSWWEHVRPWWMHRNSPNILFIKYEDMQRDLTAVIKRVAAFIGVTDLTEAQVESIVQQSTFDEMKKNDKTNITWYARHDNQPPFFRKGVVGSSCFALPSSANDNTGDWRSHFTEEQSRQIDAMNHSKLAGTGLEFDY
jgi:hypothetical protein